MKVYAIANQKGGVTKTTSTVSLSAALARQDKRVLMVDLDPQSSLTEYFVRPVDLKETTYDLIISGVKIVPFPLGRFVHLLPTTLDLAAAEIELPSKTNFEHSLRRRLREYATDYDYCILDCPPTLGVLTRIALTAADSVLIPVACEVMAIRTLPYILGHIKDVHDTELNKELYPWYILPTLFSSREKEDVDCLTSIRRQYGKLVYETPVPRKTDYKRAVRFQTDIFDIDPSLGVLWDDLATLLIQDSVRLGERVRQ